jgi:outer membrane protein OmpA-like peptidoglycan-associated protein
MAAAMFLAPCCGGCLAPVTQLNESQAQNRALNSQSQAQLAEIENLRTHSRSLERQLARAESQLAVLEDEVAIRQTQLANYEQERATVEAQLPALAAPRPPLSPATQQQLESLSRRYPSLKFDPASGISKLDTDVLFDSGQSELKPGAQEMLKGLVRALKAPEGQPLKVLVAGHTDDRGVARRNSGDGPTNNFHISAARALAVADYLRAAGLPDQRLALAAYGGHQPVAPNATPQDRQKNRRVEIFVMTADVPVVGWADSAPSLY